MQDGSCGGFYPLFATKSILRCVAMLTGKKPPKFFTSVRIKFIFLRKIVSKVTINDIVQRAGIAKGTFYLYFESKESLVWYFIDTKLSGLNKYLAKLDVEGYEKEDIEKVSRLSAYKTDGCEPYYFLLEIKLALKS